jgi:hypothetical protein
MLANGLDASGLWSDASPSDLRLLREAIRSDWPVPDERRPRIIAEVSPLVHAGQDRVAIAAAWVLVEADRANLRAEERELQRGSPGGRRTTGS